MSLVVLGGNGTPNRAAERRLFDFQTLKDVVDPANAIVLVANLLAFMVFETLFFWFIASHTVENVVQAKADFVTSFATKRDVTHAALVLYLEDPANTKALAEAAALLKQERMAYNWDLVKKMIMPAVVVLAALLMFIAVLMIYRRQPLTRIDLFLIFLVLGAFTTELYFYMTVTSQLNYIGDDDIASRLYSAVRGTLP